MVLRPQAAEGSLPTEEPRSESETPLVHKRWEHTG